MAKASEGKLARLKTQSERRVELLEALEEQIEQYAEKPDVLGLDDVARGVRVPYPQTVYNVSGDDTSGIAGLLYPSGEFIAVRHPRSVARYWEFDETLRYRKIVGYDGAIRVVGDSWTAGAVLWDGSVGGSINPNGLTGEEGDEHRAPISRREWDASITGEWATTGELWKAIELGRPMNNGPRPGRINARMTGDDGSGARLGI